MKRLLFCLFFVFSGNLFLYAQPLNTPKIWLKPEVLGDSVLLKSVYSVNDTEDVYMMLLPISFINHNIGLGVSGDFSIYRRVYDSLFQKNNLTIMSSYLTESSEKIGLWEFLRDSSRIWLNSQDISYRDFSISYRDTTERGPIVNISHLSCSDESDFFLRDTLHICKEGDNGFNGIFGEFICFDREIGIIEEQKWESYLAIKYGVTLKRNYLNTLGDTLWDLKRDSIYSKGIAGVGRDDNSTLFQKRSNIYNDIISINIKEDTIGNNTYLLWGSNGLGDVPITPYYMDTVKYLQLLREWEVRPYGFSSSINTQLIYKYPYNVSSNGIILLIDRNSSNGFSFYGSEIHYPDSVTEDAVYFNNIYWDIDHSGGDYFSVAINEDSLHDNVTLKSIIPNTYENTNKKEDLVLSITPNPSNSLFTLGIRQGVESPLKVKITDNTGKEVRSYYVSDAGLYTELQDNIDIMGIYFIQVDNNFSRKSIKLVIVK